MWEMQAISASATWDMPRRSRSVLSRTPARRALGLGFSSLARTGMAGVDLKPDTPAGSAAPFAAPPGRELADDQQPRPFCPSVFAGVGVCQGPP